MKCQRSCKRAHSLPASRFRQGWRGTRQDLSRASPHGIAPERAGPRRPRPGARAREARRQPADGDRRLLRGARFGPAAPSSSAGAQRAQRRPGPRRATPTPRGRPSRLSRARGEAPPAGARPTSQRGDGGGAVAGGGTCRCDRPAKSPRRYLSPLQARGETAAAAGHLALSGPAPSAGPPLRLPSDFPAAFTQHTPHPRLPPPIPSTTRLLVLCNPTFCRGKSKDLSFPGVAPACTTPAPQPCQTTLAKVLDLVPCPVNRDLHYLYHRRKVPVCPPELAFTPSSPPVQSIDNPWPKVSGVHLGQRQEGLTAAAHPRSLLSVRVSPRYRVRGSLAASRGGKGHSLFICRGSGKRGKKSRRGQAPGGCGLAASSAPGKGKFSLGHSFPVREGEGSWCVCPIPRDKGVFPRGPPAGRTRRTHPEKNAPQRFHPLICQEAFRCLYIKFQRKIPLGPWVDNVQAMPSYLAVFTPPIFIWPSKWKRAFLQ